MKHILILLFTVFTSFPVTLSHADDSKAVSVSDADAYAYATTTVQKNGAVFMRLHNHTETPLKVVGASSGVAKTIELHTHMMDGDMMMMREVEAYDIPAKGETVLEPMGHHIMLMGLKSPLKAGEHFTLTLEIDGQDALPVQVMIKNPGDMAH